MHTVDKDTFPSPTDVPGPTPFSVIADSTTSLYVAWSSPQPPSIHPLLLRYEILTTHTLTDLTFSSGTLPPSSSPWVVEGLNASSEYRVRVKSWSPLGLGAHGPEQTAYTYGPGESTLPRNILHIQPWSRWESKLCASRHRCTSCPLSVMFCHGNCCNPVNLLWLRCWPGVLNLVSAG